MSKICKKCDEKFEVTEEDLKFYDEVSPTFGGRKFQVPEPEMCPPCRYQRRLCFRNERNLYVRKCAATGKDIVSIFSPDKDYPPVYSQDYWWSDKWDAKDYGRDFDFNRPFFEQWGELYNEVPQLALNNNKSENSEYTNQSENNKDSYMLVACNGCKDCLYGMWLQGARDVVDCLYIGKGELCYEVVNGANCYGCKFSENLENCSNCNFSVDLIGCSDCTGCFGLRNKKYHIFNKPYSREDYEEEVKKLALDTRSGIEEMKERVADMYKSFPRKFYHGSKTENFSGDYVYEIKNGRNIFNCRYCENIADCQDAWRARNCRDLTETLENDYCYQLEGSAFDNQVLFGMKLKEVNDSYYSSHCFYSNDLFGCVGLRSEKYCILNKQYTKEEYEELVAKIIEHMIDGGEWGRYFPKELSHFGYNETVAQEYFPIGKDDAASAGYRWSDFERPMPKGNDTSSTVLNCKETGRPFALQKAEVKFYEKMGLPLPDLHPDVRHAHRMAMRTPRRLWDRKCDKCGVGLRSSYSSRSGGEKVYCESCYLKEIY